MAAKWEQRQKELDNLQALIGNMEDNDEEEDDEDFQPDPDLLALKKQIQDGDKFLAKHGDKMDLEDDDDSGYQQKQQQKSSKTQQQSGQGGISQKYKEKQGALEQQLANMEDGGDDDDEDDGPVNIAMDPDIKAMLQQGEQLQKQFGHLLPPEDQPPKKVQKAAAQTSGSKIVDADNIYSKVAQIASVEALMNEKKCYLMLASKSENPAEKKHGASQIININNLLSAIKKKHLEGNLGAVKYLEIITKTYKTQQDLYKQAKEANNSLFKARLQKRVAIIQNEYQQLKMNGEQHYQRVIGLLSNIQVQEDKKPFNYVFEIDTKEQKEQVQVLAERNIHYLNLVKYYQANMFEMKEGEITNKLKPLLLEFRDLMTQLKGGEQPKIGRFLNEKAKEVNATVFYGVPEQTYKAQIKQYIQEFEKCLELEKSYLEMIKGNRAYQQQQQVSQNKIQQYQIDINELEELLASSKMIPIPKIQKTQEDRSIKVTNTKIEKYTVKVVFKRALMCKSNKYKINWSLDILDKVFNDSTGWCDKSSLVFGYEKSLVTGDRKNPYNNIHKKKISLNVQSKGFFSNDDIGHAVIELGKLETKNTYEGSVDIQKGGKTVMQIEFGIYLRDPVATTQSGAGKTITMKIVQRYPPFDKNVGAQEYAEKCIREMQPIKEKPKIEKNEQKMEIEENKDNQNKNVNNINNSTQQQQQQQQQQQKMQEEINFGQQQQNSNVEIVILEHDQSHPDMVYLNGISDDQLPENLEKEMILNPENPEQFAFKSYLDLMEKVCPEAAMTFGSTRKRKEKALVRDLADQVQRVQIQLENYMKNGDLSQDQYNEGLGILYGIDQQLLAFYKKHQQNLKQNWCAFIEKRMELELKEMPENIKKQVLENQNQNSKQEKIGQSQKNSIIKSQVNKPQGETMDEEDEVVDSEVKNQNKNQNISSIYYKVPEKLEILEHDQGHADIQFLSSLQEQDLPNELRKWQKLIVNPEDPEIFCSQKFLAVMEQVIPEATMNFGSQRKRKEKALCRDLGDAVLKAQIVLEGALKKGEISKSQYKDKLQEMLHLDQQLLEFYGNLQGKLQQNWCGFISYRINLIQNELQNFI